MYALVQQQIIPGGNPQQQQQQQKSVISRICDCISRALRWICNLFRREQQSNAVLINTQQQPVSQSEDQEKDQCVKYLIEYFNKSFEKLPYHQESYKDITKDNYYNIALTLKNANHDKINVSENRITISHNNLIDICKDMVNRGSTANGNQFNFITFNEMKQTIGGYNHNNNGKMHTIEFPRYQEPQQQQRNPQMSKEDQDLEAIVFQNQQQHNDFVLQQKPSQPQLIQQPQQQQNPQQLNQTINLSQQQSVIVQQQKPPHQQQMIQLISNPTDEDYKKVFCRVTKEVMKKELLNLSNEIIIERSNKLINENNTFFLARGDGNCFANALCGILIDYLINNNDYATKLIHILNDFKNKDGYLNPLPVITKEELIDNFKGELGTLRIALESKEELYKNMLQYPHSYKELEVEKTKAGLLLDHDKSPAKISELENKILQLKDPNTNVDDYDLSLHNRKFKKDEDFNLVIDTLGKRQNGFTNLEGDEKFCFALSRIIRYISVSSIKEDEKWYYGDDINIFYKASTEMAAYTIVAFNRAFELNFTMYNINDGTAFSGKSLVFGEINGTITESIVVRKGPHFRGLCRGHGQT